MLPTPGSLPLARAYLNWCLVPTLVAVGGRTVSTVFEIRLWSPTRLRDPELQRAFVRYTLFGPLG